jgi:hypothetical protein
MGKGRRRGCQTFVPATGLGEQGAALGWGRDGGGIGSSRGGAAIERSNGRCRDREGRRQDREDQGRHRGREGAAAGLGELEEMRKLGFRQYIYEMGNLHRAAYRATRNRAVPRAGTMG